MYFLSTKIANYAELTCKLLPQIRGLMVSFWCLWVIFSKVMPFIVRKILKWLWSQLKKKKKFNYTNYVKTDFIAEKLIEWANMHSATLYKLTLME